MSLFLKRSVKKIFAGAINAYRKTEFASLPLYITGGGGADLELLDNNRHHWLLVTIPNIEEIPEAATVEVIEF